MVSLAAVFGGLTVLLSYFILKQQMLKSPGEYQTEIEHRLQPKYTIEEPLNSEILPHTNWPSGDFYFEVWHVEVYETRSMRWRKWLPWGRVQGRTIIKYRILGRDPPPEEQLRGHHLGVQPYVHSIESDIHDQNKLKVIYDSIDPEQVSLFVTQFGLLLRDTTFYQLNPDADLQYEMVRGEDGDLYAHFFDASLSDLREKEGP